MITSHIQINVLAVNPKNSITYNLQMLKIYFLILLIDYEIEINTINLYRSIKLPRKEGSRDDQFWRSLIALSWSQLLINKFAVATVKLLLFSQWNSSKFDSVFSKNIFLMLSSFIPVWLPRSIFLKVEPAHWPITNKKGSKSSN